jgi:hypothetical protein
MAKIQPQPLAAPTPELQDFTATVQHGFAELFFASHDHSVRSAAPDSRQGSVQAIDIVDDGTNVYLVVKTARGWFKSANFTAV